MEQNHPNCYPSILTVAQRNLLAGLGAGEYELTTVLLQHLPQATASLFQTLGIITPQRQLTAYGIAVTRLIAYQQGFTPLPY